MSKDLGHLKPSVDRAINKGVIDNWLRGVCALVPDSKPAPPQPVIAGMDITFLALNTFTLCYGTNAIIDAVDIEKMEGYENLVKASSQNNVRLDLTDMGNGNLIVDFTPEEPFSKSKILGREFTNVVPGMFGMKNR